MARIGNCSPLLTNTLFLSLFLHRRPPMGPVRGDGESLTAAILIDAIITHQITQSNVDSSIPSRDLNRPNFVSLQSVYSVFPLSNVN